MKGDVSARENQFCFYTVLHGLVFQLELCVALFTLLDEKNFTKKKLNVILIFILQLFPQIRLCVSSN